MYKIVVPTGYMGSGSSAVTDLLYEVSTYKNINGNFEYVFMHCPDGLFDLEDKLLVGNNALRSDEAIHSFISSMRKLYKYDKKYWVSGYEEKVSAAFLDYCHNFIDKITLSSFSDCYWYYQEDDESVQYKPNWILKKIIHKIGKRKKNRFPRLKYTDMCLSYPNKEDFFNNAKLFLSNIFTDMQMKYGENLVLDQLMLPHNLHRINNYFDDKIRVIVVERDPRDVFLLNKYVWKKEGVAVPYPLDVNDFCLMYRKMREMEYQVTDEKILRLQFEDLVYNYEETKELVFNFLDIDEVNHYNKFKMFDPKKSINNTKLFSNDTFKTDEVQTIERELSEFLYNFPDCFDNNSKNIF